MTEPLGSQLSGWWGLIGTPPPLYGDRDPLIVFTAAVSMRPRPQVLADDHRDDVKRGRGRRDSRTDPVAPAHGVPAVVVPVATAVSRTRRCGLGIAVWRVRDESLAPAGATLDADRPGEA